VKGCEILIGDKEVEAVEADMMLYPPENSVLTIRNKSKSLSASVKIELTSYKPEKQK